MWDLLELVAHGVGTVTDGALVGHGGLLALCGLSGTAAGSPEGQAAGSALLVSRSS